MQAEGESLTEHPGNIAPVYQLDFAHPIWQIRLDGTANQIAIECRDAEILIVNYQVFWASTGENIVKDYVPENGWWTGLAGIRDNLLFLHQTGKQGLGQPDGIMAVNQRTGTVQWQSRGVSFYGFTPDLLVVRPIVTMAESFIGLNIEAGTEIIRWEPGTNLTDLLAAYQAVQSKVYQVPAHYPETSNYFADLKSFVKLKTGQSAVAAIDYLATPAHLLMGYYVLADNGAKAYRLAVFNQLGKWLGEEEISTGLTGLGTDHFFILEGYLFLIKNKKSLLAFRF